jgi:predicted hydrocarbon binding protein
MEDRLIENKAYRVILLGVCEIVGENGLKSILNYSGLTGYIDSLPQNDNEKSGPEISEVSKLSEGIGEIYGTKGARAILFQVGRIQAKWGIDENPDVAQQAPAAMEGMSESDRAKVVLNYTAATISKQLNTETWVEQEGDVYFYKGKAATHCFNRKSDVPVCHTTTGFVNGLVAWAVGNNGWKVEEIGCMSMGEPMCTYRIEKR